MFPTHSIGFFLLAISRTMLVTTATPLMPPPARVELNGNGSAAPAGPEGEGRPCESLDVGDVTRLKKGSVLVTAYNAVLPAAESRIRVRDRSVCFDRSERLKQDILRDCPKWMYDDDEYSRLANGSVVLYEDLLEPGTYEFQGGQLWVCAADYDYGPDGGGGNSSTARAGGGLGEASVYIGKVGSSISILALMTHLVVFCTVPALRTMPGYNLASLSVAFLLAYTCVLVGQVPQVLGTPCYVSGVLQQNFFMVAFFCTNAMAFDIWRTLRRATTRLVVSSETTRRRELALYLAYSWGTPLLVTALSVVADHAAGVPPWMRPGIGRGNLCWMTNPSAKALFFTFPAFTVFVANGVFFTLSACTVRRNTMKNTGDQESQQANRLNFLLYVRLGTLMGVTWLLGVVATLAKVNWLWIASDLLNSLQGLFVFLLFSCSRKVAKHIRERVSIRLPKLSTDKQITSTTKTESQ